MFTRVSGVAPAEAHNSYGPQEGSRSKDYVYLALANSQRNCHEDAPDLFGCSLTQPNVLERSSHDEENRNPSDSRRWKLLLVSVVINVCLIVSTVTLTIVYAQSFDPGSCMISKLCTDTLWDQYQDHFYWFSWKHVTWAKAREKCRHLDADLVSIESRRENEFLIRKMLSKFKPGSRPNGFYFWIGLMRDVTASDQLFLWVDGSKAGFEEWSAGQPDNEGGLEHCGQSSLSPGNRGRWADRRCWTQQPFVCKRRVGPQKQ